MENKHKRFIRLRRKTHQKMLDMRQKGVSLADIARAFGVSRQRVHQIIKKNSDDAKH